MMTGRSRAPAEDDELDSKIDFKHAWKEFDPSLHGSITTSQFRQLMAGLGERASDAEVDELINPVDGEDKITCKMSLCKHCIG
jgi:Ca2+-binding EF-hand superfamily protein